MNKGGRGRDGVLPVGRGPCKDRPRDVEESLASFSRFSSSFLILLHWKQTFLESQVLGLQTWISGPVPLGPGETLSTQRGPFSPPRNLLSNPFNCNCHLAWLGKWLRKRRIVSGNPRCQKPFFLKEITRRAPMWPNNKVFKIIGLCAEYDAKSKGIDDGGASNGELLREFILKIMMI